MERTISQYHHLTLDRNGAGWIPSQVLGNTDFTLEQFLEHPLIYPTFSNAQTRHIGLELDIPKSTGAMTEKQRSRFLFDSYRKFVRPNISPKVLYEKAKSHLNEMRWFGIQDLYDLSLLNFCYVFQTAPFLSRDRHMVLQGRPKTSDEFEEDRE